MKHKKHLFINVLAVVLVGVAGLFAVGPGVVFAQIEVGDDDGQRIVDWVDTGINLLAALAGIAIAGAVIVSGIRYSTSGGNPQAAAAAKKHMGQALLALIAFAFLYSFLQWIVPGGVFG